MEKIRNAWHKISMHPNLSFIASCFFYWGITGLLGVNIVLQWVCFNFFAAIVYPALRISYAKAINKEELDYLAKKIAEESANIANEKEG